MGAVRSADPLPFGPPTLGRVVGRRRETADTISLDVAAEGHGEFLPGQFNMLYALGRGEVPISISGSPAAGVITHTVRAVGPTTGALAALRLGAGVGVSGPMGRPWPIQQSTGRDVVVVAGGLGLAPLRPAIKALMQNRLAYGRVEVLCGARSPSELLYRRELADWRARADLTVRVTVDAADRGWRGEVGVVTQLFARMKVAADQAVALVCGPEIMMRFAAEGLIRAGLAPESTWLAVERNMQCGYGVCGHCQLGPFLTCRDGPVLPYHQLARYLALREV